MDHLGRRATPLRRARLVVKSIERPLSATSLVRETLNKRRP